MQLKGKTALVTGGGQGIGRSFTEALLSQGCKVMICDLASSSGESTAKELAKQWGAGHVQFMPLDVTNYQQYEGCIKTTLEKMGGLDILMNNAGVFDETEKGWQRMVTINFNSVVVGTKLGMKYMKNGVIINTASVTCLTTFPTLPVYAATKAAVSHFSRSYGDPLHVAKSGMKVVAINPGFTDTEILRDIDKVIDPHLREPHRELMRTKLKTQKLNNMGRGLLQVLEKAESGQVWTIENDEPAKLCAHPA